MLLLDGIRVEMWTDAKKCGCKILLVGAWSGIATARSDIVRRKVRAQQGKC